MGPIKSTETTGDINLLYFQISAPAPIKMRLGMFPMRNVLQDLRLRSDWVSLHMVFKEPGHVVYKLAKRVNTVSVGKTPQRLV